MARWTGIVLYYTWIFFMFLALLIYAVSQAGSFNKYSCLGAGSEPTAADILALNSVANTTTTTNSTSTATLANTGPETKTNIGPVVQVLVILYGVEMGLVAVAWLFLFRLSNLEVSQFLSPGFINRCMGCLSKLIPFLVVLIHYIVLVLILILAILMFLARTCYWSYKVGNSSADHEVYKNGAVFTVIAALAWCAMHLIAGGCYRRSVTFDSYFYTPAVTNKCCRWFLINVGP